MTSLNDGRWRTNILGGFNRYRYLGRTNIVDESFRAASARMILTVLVLSLVPCDVCSLSDRLHVVVPRPHLRAGRPHASASGGDALISGDQGESKEDGPIDERTSAELYDNLKTKEFSDDLYRHLASRTDVEGTQIYTELRKRIDVDEPIRCVTANRSE